MSQEKSGHIIGINKGKVVMYGLSTCIWCKKTRQLLTDLGVDFDYIYVDLLSGDEEEKVVREVSRFNPRGSFLLLSSTTRKRYWVLTNKLFVKHLVLKKNTITVVNY